MCVLSIKLSIRKKSGNLLCAPCMSISDLNEAMTVSSSGSVFFGINLDKSSTCAISFDGKNSILNE